MKRIIMKTGLLVTAALMAASTSWATDYSSMSNEELAALRGTFKNAAVEEREAFRAEWQSRLQNMSAEEQQRLLGHQVGVTNKYQSKPGNQEKAGGGQGYGDGVDGGMGPGGPGRGNGGGMGGGMGGGQGGGNR